MQRVELRDFLDFSSLSALRLSPDGRRAAFVRSRCDYQENSYQSHIWVLDLATKEQKQLTWRGKETSFLWLDNETILFAGEKSGKLLAPSTTYYKVRVDGGEPVAAFTAPLLAAVTKRLAGTKYVIQAKTTLSDPEDLEESGASWRVATELPFLENGSGYVSGIRHRLYIYDSADGTATPITGETFQVRNDFAVHPDGTMIAYMGMDIDYMEVQKLGIFVYDVAKKETRQLLPLDRYKLRHIDFLGDRVLFTGADGSRYIWSQNAWFYTLDPVTGAEETFFESYQMPINSWVGSDCRYGAGAAHRVVGEAVYHVITQEGSSHIVRVTKGGAEEMITKKNGSVDCFDIAGDTIYMVALRDMRLQEVYQLDVKTGEETRLTSFNEGYTETHSVVAPVPCDFVNDNGDTIQGWVIPPAGYQKGKKYPGILDIHGGPKTAYGDVYYHEMQLWANRGYFVFYCNPRGSEGKGDEFGFLMTRYGTVDYDDIMAFTDQVLERWPDIDPARLGVTGGSYGGYMTNWIVGHTDRFAAAASQRSISNWISDENSSDWSYMYSPCRFGGIHARRKVEEGWASSPLKFAKNAVTPMLFIHAEEDFRCPLGEALQLYTDLINRGVETRLCLFRGENHELSRSGGPRNRVKRLEEITAWMDAHLKV